VSEHRLEEATTLDTNRRRVTRTLLLALILFAAAALRFYGLNWDGGHWLHPDERQIYFVVQRLGWPGSLGRALSPSSPLNPGFFAYGSFSIYLLKLAHALLSPLSPTLANPDNLHLIGRCLSALFDLGTIYLTYRFARLVFPPPPQFITANSLIPHLAATLAALAVLSIQLSHFYTPEPLLTFFVLLALNLAATIVLGGGRRYKVALGVSLGLALTTKVSAAPLLLLVPATYSLLDPGEGAALNDRREAAASLARRSAATLAVAALVFLVVQPYALIDWRVFVDQTIRESQIAWGRLDVPYTIQFAGTWPYLYSLWQLMLWGLGLPLGLAALAGLASALVRWLRYGQRPGHWPDTLLLSWTVPYLAMVGLLHARYLRYLQPLVPVLCILAVRLLGSGQGAWFVDAQVVEDGGAHRQARGREPIARVVGRWPILRFVGPGILLGVVAASLIYAVTFVGLYAQRHSWIQASEWLYRNLEPGSTLAIEDWDTALPLPLEFKGRSRRIEEYEVRTLPLYDEPDDTAKWEALAIDLASSDYLVIASRRLLGSIPRLPGRYPVTIGYYERLFAGDLGFELVGEFIRGPSWLNPRLPPLPGAAPALLRPDESFVVYDHPRALVFRNAGRYSAAELLWILAH
jgi:hypothetical protein